MNMIAFESLIDVVSVAGLTGPQRGIRANSCKIRPEHAWVTREGLGGSDRSQSIGQGPFTAILAN